MSFVSKWDFNMLHHGDGTLSVWPLLSPSSVPWHTWRCLNTLASQAAVWNSSRLKPKCFSRWYSPRLKGLQLHLSSTSLHKHTCAHTHRTKPSHFFQPWQFENCIRQHFKACTFWPFLVTVAVCPQLSWHVSFQSNYAFKRSLSLTQWRGEALIWNNPQHQSYHPVLGVADWAVNDGMNVKHS